MNSFRKISAILLSNFSIVACLWAQKPTWIPIEGKSTIPSTAVEVNPGQYVCEADEVWKDVGDMTHTRTRLGVTTPGYCLAPTYDSGNKYAFQHYRVLIGPAYWHQVSKKPVNFEDSNSDAREGICRAKVPDLGYFIGTESVTASGEACEAFIGHDNPQSTTLTNDVEFLDESETPGSKAEPTASAAGKTTPDTPQQSRSDAQSSTPEVKSSVAEQPKSGSVIDKPGSEVSQTQYANPSEGSQPGPNAPPLSIDKVLAFSFGAAFVIVLLIIALLVPTPTPSSFFIFRVVLALAAAGFGAIVPGLLELNQPWIRAGGAMGLFVLVYLLNPPKLVGPHEQAKEKKGIPPDITMKRRDDS